MGTLPVGHCLNLALRVWARNFLPFTFLAICFTLPCLAVLLPFPELVSPEQPEDPQAILLSMIATLALQGANVLCSALLSGVLTHTVVRQVLGHTVGLGEALAVGLRRFGAVLLVSIAFATLQVIGMLLLLLPFFYMLCTYLMCVPVCVIERPGLLQSLHRSAHLAAGNRWRILLLFVAYVALAIPLGMVVSLLLEKVAVSYKVQLALNTLAMAPFTTLYVVLPAVVYTELRRLKEGLFSSELSDVFE